MLFRTTLIAAIEGMVSVSLFQPGYYGREVVKQVEESNLTGVSQTRKERLHMEVKRQEKVRTSLDRSVI